MLNVKESYSVFFAVVLLQCSLHTKQPDFSKIGINFVTLHSKTNLLRKINVIEIILIN